VTAAAEGTASRQENTFFTKDFFETITQTLLEQCMLFQKKRSTKLHVKNDTEAETPKQNKLEKQLRSGIVKTE